MLSEFLKYHRYLAPLCKDMKAKFENSRLNGGSVADLILSVFALVSRDTEFQICDSSVLADFREDARELTATFLADTDEFQDLLTVYSEMFLLDFIADKVAGFNLDPKLLKKTLNTLFAWGLMDYGREKVAGSSFFVQLEKFYEIFITAIP